MKRASEPSFRSTVHIYVCTSLKFQEAARAFDTAVHKGQDEGLLPSNTMTNFDGKTGIFLDPKGKSTVTSARASKSARGIIGRQTGKFSHSFSRYND